MFSIFVWFIWLALSFTLILVLCSWQTNHSQQRWIKMDLKSKPKYILSKHVPRKSLPKHGSPRSIKQSLNYIYRPVYYYDKNTDSYARNDQQVKQKKSRSPSKKKPLVKSTLVEPRESSNHLSEKGQVGLSYHYYFDLLKKHGYVQSVSEYQTGDIYKKFLTKSIKKQISKNEYEKE